MCVTENNNNSKQITIMNKQIFILAMAAIGFVACSSDETVAVNQNDPDAISFRPLVTGVTRAADKNIGNLTSFNVTAYTTAETPAEYFENVTFSTTDGTPTASSTYTSVTKYYWPSSGNLSFYAYAPTDGATTSTGTTWAQITRTNYTTFVVKPSTVVSEQADLIYACNKNVAKVAAGVPLRFRHTGAKIICKVKNSSTTLKFAVDGWKVGFLKNSRQFTLGGSEVTSSDGTFAFGDWTDIASGDFATTRVVSNEYASTWTTATDIAAKSETDEHLTTLTGEMILLPQTITKATKYAHTGATAAGDKLDGAFIAVKLKIMNNDAGSSVIVSGNEGATIWAIWPIGDNLADDAEGKTKWEPGKQYTYTIDLAGGGYYETNQTETTIDEDLDQILDGAEIKFVGVSVDNWSDQTNINVP